MLGYDWGRADALSTDIRARYNALVQHLINKGLMPAKMLLERLEESTLTGCSLIADSALFMKKRVRIQTRITYYLGANKYHDLLYIRYEQQKFNLLREESEGFAKVIAELTLHKLTAANVPTVLSNIQSLIGSFFYNTII